MTRKVVGERKRITPVRLEVAERQALDREARELGLSRSTIMRIALREFLAARREK